MRFRTFLFTALAELTTISTSTSAHAGASDYAFEPAQADGQGRAWRCPVSDPARHGAGQYGRHDCQARGQAIFRAGCLSLPFALVGGLWLMWWMGFNLSVAVAVGFIALAGVAAQTGVVMLIYLDHALEARRTLAAAAGRAMNRADLYAVERVRPKIMTVIAIMAGLLPILWSHGTGSEVMQRIAVPMIGGMVSSTILTLLVIPAIYAVVKGIGISRSSPPGIGDFRPG